MIDSQMNVLELPDHVRMIRDVVKRFVDAELKPLEELVLRRESERGMADTPILPPDVEGDLQKKAKDIGLWGIDVPAKYGGQNLGAVTKCAVIEQLKRTIVPFILPPDSPNLYLLEPL